MTFRAAWLLLHSLPLGVHVASHCLQAATRMVSLRGNFSGSSGCVWESQSGPCCVHMNPYGILEHPRAPQSVDLARGNHQVLVLDCRCVEYCMLAVYIMLGAYGSSPICIDRVQLSRQRACFAVPLCFSRQSMAFCFLVGVLSMLVIV